MSRDSGDAAVYSDHCGTLAIKSLLMMSIASDFNAILVVLVEIILYSVAIS